MDSAFQLGAQILFAIAAIAFVGYSVIAMYTLNNYGQSKKVTSGLNITYAICMLGLLAWGLMAVIKI